MYKFCLLCFLSILIDSVYLDRKKSHEAARVEYSVDSSAWTCFLNFLFCFMSQCFNIDTIPIKTTLTCKLYGGLLMIKKKTNTKRV